MDQSVPNDREEGIIKISKSGDITKTLKCDYSIRLIVEKNLLEQDGERDVLDTITAHFGNEVPL